MTEVLNLTKVCLFCIWLNVAIFHMNLVFGVGYLLYAFLIAQELMFHAFATVQFMFLFF